MRPIDVPVNTAVRFVQRFTIGVKSRQKNAKSIIGNTFREIVFAILEASMLVLSAAIPLFLVIVIPLISIISLCIGLIQVPSLIIKSMGAVLILTLGYSFVLVWASRGDAVEQEKATVDTDIDMDIEKKSIAPARVKKGNFFDRFMQKLKSAADALIRLLDFRRLMRGSDERFYNFALLPFGYLHILSMSVSDYRLAMHNPLHRALENLIDFVVYAPIRTTYETTGYVTTAVFGFITEFADVITKFATASLPEPFAVVLPSSARWLSVLGVIVGLTLLVAVLASSVRLINSRNFTWWANRNRSTILRPKSEKKTDEVVLEPANAEINDTVDDDAKNIPATIVPETSHGAEKSSNRTKSVEKRTRRTKPANQ